MKDNKSRVFKLKEQFQNIYYGAKGFVLLRASKKSGLMNKKFKERIMLAVTEVNGCSMCSFIHAKIALSSGMSKEKIKEILNGNNTSIPLSEAVGVMFSQDFAYSNEHPIPESIKRVIREYGIEKTKLILASCYMITMTNGMGTSLDYLYSRLRFNRNKESNIFIELLNPLATIIFFPLFVIVFGVFTFFGRKPNILFPLFSK